MNRPRLWYPTPKQIIHPMQGLTGFGGGATGLALGGVVEETGCNKKASRCAELYVTYNSLTLSNSNMTACMTSGTRTACSTVGKGSGKWYWEAHADSGTTNGTVGGRVGIGFRGESMNNNPESQTFAVYWHSTMGVYKQIQGSNTNIHNSGTYQYGDGDMIGVALNCDDNEVSFYKEGTLVKTYDYSGDATGAGKPMLAQTWNASSGTPCWTYNFGASSFQESVPSGFNEGLYYCAQDKRYWRYKIGGATQSHHPNAAAYFVSDGTTDFEIKRPYADNCSDQGQWGTDGTYYPSTSGSDTNYVNACEAKIYSSYNGGNRGAEYTVSYSTDQSSWTDAFNGVMANNSQCGLKTGTGGTCS